jgi:DNA repair exonuclease SbcCD nuclease subunit
MEPSVPQFLHAADIHLDSPMEGFRQRLDGVEDELLARATVATRTAFEALVDTALEYEVAALILAGDLYDGDWRDFSTGLWFSQQMDRLHQATIPVYMLRGNHDAASQITRSLRLPPNVHQFATASPESVVSPDDSLVLHGQGFARRAVSDNLASRYPAADRGRLNIGVLHTSLTGREGHEAYAPCELNDLSSRGYQYWALGHVHKREQVSTDPWIVFPGNLQGRHIRESGAKGATLVTYEETAIIEVEPLMLHDVRWERVLVPMAGVATRDGALDAMEIALEELGGRLDVAGDDSPVVVRLALQGATTLHGRLQEPAMREELWAQAQGMASRAAGRGVLVERVVVGTQDDRDEGDSAGETVGLVLGQLLDDPTRRTALEHVAAAELRELDRRFRLGLGDDPEFDPGQLLAEAQALLESRVLHSDPMGEDA